MCNCNNQYVLHPELESLLYGEYDFENPKGPALKKRTPAVPSKTGCVGETDITTDFRDFVARAQTIINRSTALSQAEIRGIVNMIQAIISPEAGVEIMKFKVFSCSRINNPLLMFGESAGAEIDIAGKTLRLTDGTWSRSADFLATNDLAALTSLFQTIAHEKRHATLGSLVHVTTTGLQKGIAASETSQVEYRVQEILVLAEEIAIGKRMDSRFSVSLNTQKWIRKHWSMVEARVNNTERDRLRNLIIIAELRNRYGFKNSCDNAITLGVVSSMETAKWHVCASGSVVGNAPAGLKLCPNKDKTHQVCGIH